MKQIQQMGAFLFSTTGVAISIPVVLIAFFSLLLSNKSISENPYVLLVCASILTGFVIYFKDRVKVFSLREMKIILAEAKGVEASVKRVAEAVIEIIAFHSAYTSGTSEHRKALNHKMESALKTLQTSPAKIDRLMKLPRLMERFMGEKDDKKIEQLKKEIEKEKLFF